MLKIDWDTTWARSVAAAESSVEKTVKWTLDASGGSRSTTFAQPRTIVADRQLREVAENEDSAAQACDPGAGRGGCGCHLLESVGGGQAPKGIGGFQRDIHLPHRESTGTDLRRCPERRDRICGVRGDRRRQQEGAGRQLAVSHRIDK